jgi:hypothetical protein
MLHQQQLVVVGQQDASISTDSLPYIDEPLQPEDQQRVQQLIQQELNSADVAVMPQEYHPHPLFEASILWKHAIARLEKEHEEEEGVDLDRYALPENSALAYQYERWRSDHLDLMLEYGADAYKQHILALEKVCAEIRNRVDSVKGKINDVNKKRKFDQDRADKTLSRLRDKFKQEVVKNHRIRAQLNTQQK